MYFFTRHALHGSMIVCVKGESERLVEFHLRGSNTLHTRFVRDVSGLVWQVTEFDAHDVPGAMAATCLIFDSASVCRRYWSYPANWRTRSDVHLLDFMNQSRPSVL